MPQVSDLVGTDTAAILDEAQRRNTVSKRAPMPSASAIRQAAAAVGSVGGRSDDSGGGGRIAAAVAAAEAMPVHGGNAVGSSDGEGSEGGSGGGPGGEDDDGDSEDGELWAVRGTKASKKQAVKQKRARRMQQGSTKQQGSAKQQQGSLLGAPKGQGAGQGNRGKGHESPGVGGRRGSSQQHRGSRVGELGMEEDGEGLVHAGQVQARGRAGKGQAGQARGDKGAEVSTEEDDKVREQGLTGSGERSEAGSDFSLTDEEGEEGEEGDEGSVREEDEFQRQEEEELAAAAEQVPESQVPAGQVGGRNRQDGGEGEEDACELLAGGGGCTLPSAGQQTQGQRQGQGQRRRQQGQGGTRCRPGRAGSASVPVVICMVGEPNVGKSSTLNSLLGTHRVAVSSHPGCTKHYQTHYMSERLLLCDCPGLVFPRAGVSLAMQVLFGSYPIARCRDPYAVVTYLAERIWPRLHAALGLSRAMLDLDECGGVGGKGSVRGRTQGSQQRPELGGRVHAAGPAITAGAELCGPRASQRSEQEAWSTEELLSALAHKKNWRSRKGRLDLYRAANWVLRSALAGRPGTCLGFLPPREVEDVVSEPSQGQGQGGA